MPNYIFHDALCPSSTSFNDTFVHIQHLFMIPYANLFMTPYVYLLHLIMTPYSHLLHLLMTPYASGSQPFLHRGTLLSSLNFRGTPITENDLLYEKNLLYALIHVLYLCIDNYIIHLTMEFISVNLVYSECLFIIYCFCSFIMSAIKGGHPKQT